MTLVTPQADGSETTGREIEDFALNLDETEENIEDLREKVFITRKSVQATRWSLEQVGEVEDQATDFLATIKSMKFSLKLAGKVGPLKLPAKFVGQVLERLEDVAVKVRDKARSMEKKIKDGDYIAKLKNAENKLLKAEKKLKTAEKKVEKAEGATKVMVSTFDAVDALGSNALDGIEGAASDAARPINDVLVPINRIYNDIEEELSLMNIAFSVAGAAEGLFDALSDVAKQFGAINAKLGFLKGPLAAVQKALAPIEWVLDAVGFLYDITVGPVVNFLLDKLGITAIFNRLGDEIAKLLPDIGILDEMERRMLEAFGQLEDFLGGFEERVDQFVEDITDKVLDAISALAPDAIRFGTEETDTMHGRTNDFDVFVGLEGNDSIYGYASGDSAGSATVGDMFIASGGDDFNYGGAGEDWLVLRDTVANYRIAQFSDTAPVVFTHSGGLWGREVAYGIENYVFNDGVFTLAQLIDMGALSEPANNNDNLIIAGDDDDIIAPLGGSDTVDGGAGSDTFLLPVGQFGGNIDIRLQWAISDNAGKEYDGFAWDGRDRDFLDSIENITVELDRDAKLRGTDGNNVLISGDGDDFQRGLAGDDLLISGDGDDVLIGGEGQDQAYAGDGNDIIFGGPIAAGKGEVYDGGRGTFDRLSYSTDSNYFNFDVSNELRSGDLESPGPLRIDGSTGLVEHMDGATVLGADTIRGIEYLIAGDGDDTITGYEAEDAEYNSIFDGGDGDDLIFTGNADEIYGGFGSDTVILTEFGGYLEGGQSAGGGSSGGDEDTLDMRQAVDARFLIVNEFNQRVDYTAFGDFEVERLANDRGQKTSGLTELGEGQFTSFDVLLLGSGNDEYYARGTARNEVFGAGGDDIMIRRQGNDGGAQAYFHGGDGNDYIEFDVDGNEAYGDAGDDRLIINTSKRDVVLDGGTGDDFVRVTRAFGEARGGEGYDVLSLDTRLDTGTYRSRVDLRLGTAEVFFRNNQGNDQAFISFTGVSGFEEVIGGEIVRDLLNGSNDDERLIGRGGNDSLNSFQGDDELYGGDGDDRLNGYEGDDLLHGGAGNDRLFGDFTPGESDTASYSNTWFDGPEGELTAGNFGAVQVDLRTGLATGAQGNDTLTSIENVIGSSSGDDLRGDDGDNVLSGGDGDDTLVGRDGDDVLVLGAGNDVAEGGAGDDTIIIGAGNATVDGGSGRDRVDFGAVEGSVALDFADFSYVARLKLDTPVWRDTGSAEARVWEGDVLTPQDIIETELAFANSDDDLTRDLPGVDDPDVDRFEVVFEEQIETFEGSLSGVEEVSTGAGNDTLFGTEGSNWMDGGAGDDLIMGGEVRQISFESSEAKVFRVYQATLARNPDQGGFEGWIDRLESGARSLSEITNGFVASSEFQATYGALANGAFVDLLYANVLDRTADDAGRQGWVSQLESGTERSAVVLGFSESQEFKVGTALNASTFATGSEAKPWVDDVYRLYQATLDRTPDYLGLQGWTDALGSGGEFLGVVTGFVASTEFQATYGALDNEAFVTLLYGNVLGRGPDAAGLNGWLDRMASGSSREEVVTGFSQSSEFINATNPALVDFMRTQEGDTIRGGAGDDLIAGEIASDTFVFDAMDSGRDVVLSLDAWDTLEFTGFGYANADEARAKMVQQGSAVVFTDTVTFADPDIEDSTVIISFNDTTLGLMQSVEILV